MLEAPFSDLALSTSTLTHILSTAHRLPLVNQLCLVAHARAAAEAATNTRTAKSHRQGRDALTRLGYHWPGMCDCAHSMQRMHGVVAH